MFRSSKCAITATFSVLFGAVIIFGNYGSAFAADRCSDPRVAKAAKEGELIVVSSIFETPETQNAHRKGFIKHWCLPKDFKIKYDIRNTPGTIARIEAEAKNNVKISGDVTTMPAITWFMDAVKRGLIMAYNSPEYVHMKLPEKIGLNNIPYWTSDMYMFVPMWNGKTMPNLKVDSWMDLLKPELKGKMSILDGSVQQSTALAYWFLKDKLPADYWKKLAAQDILIASTSLASVEMMMSGERPFSVLGVSADACVLHSQGHTFVKTAAPKEGVMLQEQATAAFKDAPHPNATQLWIDFLRSHDGQVIFEKNEGRDPGRAGVPSSCAVTPDGDSLFGSAFAPDYKQMVRDPNLVKKAQKEFGAIFVNK